MICCRPCCAIISTSESVALFAPLSCKRQRGFFVGGCVPGRCSYPAGRRGAFHANKHGLRHPVSASLTLASCWPLPQQLLPVSATGGGRRCCRPFHRPPYCPCGQQGPTPADGPQRNSRPADRTDAACRPKWTFHSIYVISVKKTAAGLIFYAFSCKLKVSMPLCFCGAENCRIQERRVEKLLYITERNDK